MNDLFNQQPTEIKHTVRIEFDGGTPCNDPKKGFGIGYGSYTINGGRPVRVSHGIPCSNNAAEVLTLVSAIHDVRKTYEPRDIRLLIVGDSQITLNWVRRATGELKSKKGKKASGSPLFKESIRRLSDSLSAFGKIEAKWQPREKSVKTFGH